MTKEQAIKNVHWLVNTCIERGGVFKSIAEVQTLSESLATLAAPPVPAPVKTDE